MQNAKNVKTHARHAFSQFKLTNWLLNNLSQFELSPVEKLVLLELSICYNPNKADMFPKQKTIASKLGISERSVVRAIQSLVKAGLILVECKYTNRYKFTSRMAFWSEKNKNFCPDTMSDCNTQSDTQQNDNLTPAIIEPTIEQKKEPQEDVILQSYAKKHNAKNVDAYVRTLKKNGSSVKILSEYKAKRNADRYAKSEIEATRLHNEQIRDFSKAVPPTESCLRIKEMLMKNKALL